MSAVDASSAAGITYWLIRWRDGDLEALDRPTKLVYGELRRLAAARLRKERDGHILQSTALVRELYLHLRGTQGIDWKCRGQFFAISAKLMRRILVDHARKRAAGKRGGAVRRIVGVARRLDEQLAQIITARVIEDAPTSMRRIVVP